MSDVNVADEVCIPSSVCDLPSFQEWAKSEEYPEHGWVSFLDGVIWVDMSMEQLFTHNAVKTEYANVLGPLVNREDHGYYFSDRVLLSNIAANLSTEPDGMFCSYEALAEDRVRFIEAADQGYVEVHGSPDMVLEVVSRYSVRKDTEVLRDLYFRADIAEYWLVDARSEPIRFDILRRNGRGYAATRKQKGWLKSKVFGRSFMLDMKRDRLGNPRFMLRVQD